MNKSSDCKHENRFLSAQTFMRLPWGVGIVVRPDGKILTAMWFFKHSDTKIALAQLLPNGQRDSTFGNNGVYIPPLNLRSRTMDLYGNKIYVSAQEGQHDIVLLRFMLDLNVGILDPKAQPDPILWIYPNPISEQFTLQFWLTEKAEVSIHLFDLQGKLVQALVQNQSFEHGDYTLDLSCPGHLPAGNYVLTMEVAGKKRTSIQIMKK